MQKICSMYKNMQHTIRVLLMLFLLLLLLWILGKTQQRE